MNIFFFTKCKGIDCSLQVPRFKNVGTYSEQILDKETGYLIDQNVYSVENRIVEETDLSYFTEFGEKVGQSYDTEKNNG